MAGVSSFARQVLLGFSAFDAAGLAILLGTFRF